MEQKRIADGLKFFTVIVAVVGVMLLFVPFKTVAVITRLVGLCLCDGAQSLTPAQIDEVSRRVNAIREALV